MSALGQLKVGDVLWLQSSERYMCSGGITLTKVGRKWAYFDEIGSRFDMETGEVDGIYGNSSGQVYASEAFADTERRRLRVWSRIKHGMGYTPGEDVTLSRVMRAADLLGISIEKELADE